MCKGRKPRSLGSELWVLPLVPESPKGKHASSEARCAEANCKGTE